MDKLKLKMLNKPIPKKRKAVEVSFVNVTGAEIVEDIDSTVDIKAFQHLIGKITREKTPLPIPQSILPPLEVEPKSKPKLKRPPGRPKKIKLLQEIPKLDDRDVMALEILGKRIMDRLPPKQPSANIIETSYFKENRQIFTNFINSIFQPYLEKINSQEEETCDSMISGDFSLLTHQEIVRDYINLYTPYTGLLLYHGLGSGKTCSSIAIAEGIKSHNVPNHKIIIMTPASLEKNYIEELKYCGDFMYKKTQHWDFMPFKKSSKEAVAISETLNLSIDYANKKKGAKGVGLWIMDKDKASNYDSLSASDKLLVDNQINEMIQSKYLFIHYNGITRRRLNAYKKERKTENLFDNSVIIIDEAHNFVSRIVNKLGRNDTLTIELYKMILSAKNCRKVFLSGTPIINYPNEIAVMFNLLRGYIKTYVFNISVKSSKKINNDTMKELLKPIKQIDTIEYIVSRNIIKITLNPYGFSSMYDRENSYKGVTSKDSDPTLDDKNVETLVKAELKKHNIHVERMTIETDLALPDNLDEFKNKFLDISTSELKNDELFKRRIIGLTSYYKSAKEELMPRYNEESDFHVERIPMSDYQFGVYEVARSDERKLERLRSKRKKIPGRDGVYSDSVSTYRIFSRAFCNFVFPEEISRPFPSKDDSKDKSKVLDKLDEDALDNITIEDRLQNVDGAYTEDDDKQLKKMDEVISTDYSIRIKEALQQLEVRGGEFLTPEALETYSPKFNKMLATIQSASLTGKHLIYSQFRTLEGIGIFRLVLMANGFAEFKLKFTGGVAELDISTEDMSKPKFVLYTGTETSEYKELVRNIYNGNWKYVPDNIKQKFPILENNYGEIIKIFMITASGAEGISLKSTKYVHIMEPYWHPVRVNQVIGRAQRICSHKDLPEEDRTVDVFLYLMSFTPEQLESDASVDLKHNDSSKLNPTVYLTSDEALYEISNIKSEITKRILNAVKESAIDCNLYKYDDVTCFSFSTTDSSKLSYNASITSEQSDKVALINKKEVKLVAEKISLDGKDYAYVKTERILKKYEKQDVVNMGELYDYDSYVRSQKGNGSAINIGKLLIFKNGSYRIEKIR
jgi:hypothetical protein